MDILDLFIRQLASKDKSASKNTVKNYSSDIRHFINWCEKSLKSNFEANSISPDIISLYEKSQGGMINGGDLDISSKLGAASMKRHMSSLRKFFAFLAEERIITSNPFNQIQPPVSDTPTDYWHIRSFRDFLASQKVSKITANNYISDILGFAKWYEQAILPTLDSPLASKGGFYLITQSVLTDYKDRLTDIQNAAPRTINRKLSALRRYLDFASKKGFIDISELSLDPVEISQNRVEEENQPQIRLSEIKYDEPKNLSYSTFPPIRLIQRLVIFPYLGFEDKAAGIIASIIAGKPVEGLQKLPSSITKELNRKNYFRTQNLNISSILGVRGIQKEFYQPNKVSLLGQPLHKKIIHHVRFSRPSWYHKYHSYAFVHYAHFALLIIFASGVGIALYTNLVGQKQREASAAPTAPPRILSFQGRLTDNLDNPITTPTDIRFSIYNDPTASGAALLWQEVQYLIEPDQDGIFSVLLGSNTTIPSTVFSDNSSIYLGVTIRQTSELTPRQRVASVGYATNAEFLQGLPPTTQAGITSFTNVVLALDSSGNLTLSDSSPTDHTFQVSNGTFTLSGQPLYLSTNTGSDGDIILSPDGLGKINLQKGLVNTTLNGNISPGAVEVNDKFAVLATESAVAAFIVNNNTAGGDIFTASSSGTARFTIQNDGTLISGLYTGQNGVLYGTQTSGIIAQATTSSSGLCLQSGLSTPTWGTCGDVGYWNLTDGALAPIHNSVDVLFGGQATESAKFRFLNNISGTPVASISANSGNNALFVSGDGTLGTTNRQSLTIGNSSTYNTTGNILINPNGIGRIGIFTANPLASFDLRGISGTQVAASISANTTAPALLIDNSGTGDFLAASKGGQIYFRMNANNGTYLGTPYDGELIVGKNGAGKLTALVVDPVIVSNQKTSGTQSLTLHTAGSTNADFIFRNVDTQLALLSQAGQLGLEIQGSTGGLTIGGDTHLFRGDTNRLDLASDDSFNVVSGSIQIAGVTRIDSSGNGIFNDISISGTCTGCVSSSNSPFQVLDGAIVPHNSTLDFLIGGQATTSAKFAVLNVAGGTPTASISAGTSGGVFLSASGNLATTANQTLTLGGTTTGNIIVDGVTKILLDNGTVPGYASSVGLGVINSSASSDDAAIAITSGSNGNSTLFFGSDSSYDQGYISYNSSTPTFTFGTGASDRLVIDSLGEIGINTVNPDQLLTIDDGSIGFSTGDGTSDVILTRGAADRLDLADGDTFRIIGGQLQLDLDNTGSTQGIVWGSSQDVNLYRNGSGQLATDDTLSVGGDLIIAGTCTGCGGVTATNSPFEVITAGAITQKNTTLDFLIGGTTTSSAKFAVMNMAGGTPTASISANSGNNALYFTGDGTLATTNRQTLTLGNSSTYNTTGNILLHPNGTGYVGIGTSNPTALLALKGTNTDATLGSEKVTNGGFTGSATGWILGTGWAYNSNNVSKTPGTASSLEQDVSAVAGETYAVSFTVSNMNQGSVGAEIGGTIGTGTYTNITGFYQIITAVNSGNLKIVASSTFNGVVDGVTVKKITPSNSIVNILNSDDSLGIEIRSGGSIGGGDNTFIGIGSGMHNIVGNSNTALGTYAQYSNTIGGGNSSLGAYALYSNTSGNFNTAIGSGSLYGNRTGSYNIAIGDEALYYNRTGSQNIAIGSQALWNNWSGSVNYGIGMNALFTISDGSYNLAFGQDALASVLDGQQNTALGHYALTYSTGSFNVAVGDNALVENLTGDNNTALGQNADGINLSGHGNTTLGASARSGVSGNYNIAIGYTAGWANTTYNNQSGSNNIYLGYNSGPYTQNATFNNSAAIGAFALVNASNALVLGGTSNSIYAVNVGIGTATPSATLDIQGGNRGGNAALIVNQLGSSSNNILTASSSGTTRLTIDNSGNLQLYGQADLRFADSDSSNYVAFQAPATVGSNVTWTLPDADASGCFQSNGSGTLSIATCGSGGDSLWSQNLGLLYPGNTTMDLAIGGTASSSAKFLFANVNAGTPTLKIFNEAKTQSLNLYHDGTNGNIISTTGTLNLGQGGGTLYLETDIVNDTTNFNGAVKISDKFLVQKSESAGTALAVFDNTGAGDIFTASASGSPRFVVTNSGGIRLTAGQNLDTITAGSLGIGITNANAITIGNTTGATALNFDVGTGGINFGDNAVNKTIDIGGVTNSAQDTINIGTNSTAADTITIGNSNASTTLALTGGTAWSVTTGGVLTVTSCTGCGGGGGAFDILTATGVTVQKNTTTDLLLGGIATTSAKFIVLGSNGNVGIGLSDAPTGKSRTPEAKLDIYSSLGTSPAASISANTSAPVLQLVQNGPGDLLVASKSGATFLRFGIGSGNSLGVDYAGYFEFGLNGTGKMTFGVQDPPYTIDGVGFATYAPSVLGLYEELLGKAVATYDPVLKAYAYKLDFNNFEQHSDLWVFNRIIEPDITGINVSMTPNSNARTWYKKDGENRTIILYSDRPTEISYRLSGKRFDAANYPTLRTSGPLGYVPPPPTLDGSGENDNNIDTDPYFDLLTISHQNGEWKLIDGNNNQINHTEAFSRAIIAKITAGLVEAQKIVVGDFNATTAFISGLSGNTLSFVTGTFNNITASFSNLGSATASSLAVTTDNLSIAGVSLKNYINQTVTELLSNTYSLLPNNIISPAGEIENISTNIISPLADTSAPSLEFRNSKLEVRSLGETVSWFDSEGNASFSGTLTSNNIQTNNASVSGNLAANTINSQTTTTQTLTTNEATVSGTLYANNIDLSNEALAKLEGDLNVNDKIGTLAAVLNGSYQPQGSGSGEFSNLFAGVVNATTITADFGIFEQGITSMGPITATDITAIDTLGVGSNFTISNNAVNTLGAELALQSLRQADITFQGGLIRMDTDGNMNIAGNLNLLGEIDAVHGVFSATLTTPALATSLISPLAGDDLTIKLTDKDASVGAKLRITDNQNKEVLAVDNKGNIISSGAATLAKLNFNLVGEAQASSLTEAIATGSAGFATLRANQPEITIKNPNVTSKSLIYITPFGDTDNKVLYLLRQVPQTDNDEGSFTVGASGTLSTQNIQFNWLIVN